MVDRVSSARRDTRSVILDAARDLYETQGYFGVGLEAVAKKAGVSRQAIYLHFESKAELLRALHERVFTLDVAPIQERIGLWDAPTAIEALDRWASASTEVIPRIIGISNALDAARLVDPDVEETFQAPREGRRADCLRMAKWLKRDGVLKPGLRVGDCADILFTISSIRTYESLVVGCGWSPERYQRWLRPTLRELLTNSNDAN